MPRGYRPGSSQGLPNSPPQGMPTLQDLQPGAYGTGRERFTGSSAVDAKSIVPWSAISKPDIAPTDTFNRKLRSNASGVIDPRFRKRDLGTFEVEDTFSTLRPGDPAVHDIKPPRGVLGPGKRQRTWPETIEDVTIGTLHGMGKETLTMPGIARDALEAIGGESFAPELLDILPSKEDIIKYLKKKGAEKYIPFTEEISKRLTEGPQTKAGERAQSLAEWAPYLATGARAMPEIVKRLGRGAMFGGSL